MRVLEAKLLKEAGFFHGFTTREGGVSPAPFDSADFQLKGREEEARGGGDALALRDAVSENLRRLARAVGFELGALYQVSQVHGAHVAIAEGDPEAWRAIEADALVARPVRVGPQPAVAVRIADCAPVLVGDPTTGAAVAIHAGWRGVVAGVVRAGIDALAPASRDRLVAAIGPCIGPCCFEVGIDVAEKIAGSVGDVALVVERHAGKAMVDLRRAVRAELASAGLRAGRVETLMHCTKCDAARFYSFRRDGANSGRHVAVIRAGLAA